MGGGGGECLGQVAHNLGKEWSDLKWTDLPLPHPVVSLQPASEGWGR